jgi:hypothetical protein
MQDDKPLEIKAMNKAQLAQYFGISYWVLRKWLTPFKDKIGDIKGNMYTPKQIRVIIDCLG